MFRSTKKLADPPKPMTMQEIEEDLETFSKLQHKRPINKFQILDDLSERKKTDDLKNLSLSEWWDAFEVNKLQMEDLDNLLQNLGEKKHELKEQVKEIEDQKSALMNEIEENLRRIREIKTPIDNE